MRYTVTFGAVSMFGAVILIYFASTASAVAPTFVFPRSFRSGSAQTVTIENSLSENIKCSESENTAGMFSGRLAAGVVFKLKSCKMGTMKCSTAGAGNEEIVTKKLAGVLGYLPGAARGAEKVTLAIEAEVGSIAAITCGLETYELKGCLVATLARAGNPGPETAQFSLELEQAGGTQKYVSYEKELGVGLTACSATLESGMLNPAAGITMKQVVLITPCSAMEKIND